MEKISGILPSNSRITTVDLGSGGTSRPGTNSFGRPEGVPAADLKRHTTADKAMSAFNKLDRIKSQEHARLKIVEDAADKFFMRQKQYHQDALAEPGIPASEVVSLVSVRPASNDETQPVPILTEPAAQPVDDLDSPEMGRYLDVNV